MTLSSKSLFILLFVKCYLLKISTAPERISSTDHSAFGVDLELSDASVIYKLIPFIFVKKQRANYKQPSESGSFRNLSSISLICFGSGHTSVLGASIFALKYCFLSLCSYYICWRVFAS